MADRKLKDALLRELNSLSIDCSCQKELKMYHTIVYLYKNLIKQLKSFQTGAGPLGHPVYKPECVVKIYTWELNAEL